MSLTISAQFRRNLVSKAVKDLPLEQRVDHVPSGPVDFSKLMVRGLCLAEIAALAGCTASKVHSTVRNHYDNTEWNEIWANNARARATLRREVQRDAFWGHRFHMMPEVTAQDKKLVQLFGSPAEVRRHTEAANRQGVFAC